MKCGILRRTLSLALSTAIVASSIPYLGGFSVFAAQDVTFTDTFASDASLDNWTTDKLGGTETEQKPATVQDGCLVPPVFNQPRATVTYASAPEVTDMRISGFTADIKIAPGSTSAANSHIVLYYDRSATKVNQVVLAVQPAKDKDGTANGDASLQFLLSTNTKGISISQTVNAGYVLRAPYDFVDIAEWITLHVEYDYSGWSNRELILKISATYTYNQLHTQKPGQKTTSAVRTFKVKFADDYTPVETFSVGFGGMQGNAAFTGTIFDNVTITGEKNDSAADQAAAEQFRADYSEVLSKTPDTVTAEDKAQVDEALAAYNLLYSSVQELLSSEKELLDALAAAIYDNEAEAFKTAHAGILSKTVQTLVLADAESLQAALTAYAVLSAEAQGRLTEQKALLDALQQQLYVLEAAEFKAAHAAALAMDPAQATPDDADVVNAALTAYGLLSNEAQKLLTAEKAKLDELVTALADYFIRKFRDEHADILAMQADDIKVTESAAVNAALKDFYLLSDSAKTDLDAERILLFAMKERLIRLSGQKADGDDFEDAAYTDIVWEDQLYKDTGKAPAPHHTAQEEGAVPPNRVLFPAGIDAGSLTNKYVTAIKMDYWPVGKIASTEFRFKLTADAVQGNGHSGGFAAYIDPVTGFYAGLQFTYSPNKDLPGSPNVLSVKVHSEDINKIAIHPGGGSANFIGAASNDTAHKDNKNVSKDIWVNVKAEYSHGTLCTLKGMEGLPQLVVYYTITAETLSGEAYSYRKEVRYIFKDEEMASRISKGRNGFIRGIGDSCMYDDYKLTMSATAQEYADAFRAEHQEILAKAPDAVLGAAEMELLELAINGYYGIGDATVKALLSAEAETLKALAVANGGDDPAVTAFRDKYSELLAKNELTVVPADEAVVDEALAELDSLDVFIKMVLSEEKLKLDLFKKTLLVYVPPRTDPDDMSPFTEDFEGDLRQWDRVYQESPPFPVKDEMAIVADPDNPDNQVLYIKANAAVLVPRDIVWPQYGAMTRVTYRMRLESLEGNPNNKNGTFVSFVDFENYNRISQGLNPNAQNMPRMQADSVVDGEKSSSRWYDSAPFDPNGGWFDVSIVFSGRNAIVSWTDAEGRSVSCAVTANVAYGVLALGQPAGSQDMKAVWIDDVKVEFTKEDWDVDDDIEDIEVYYSGNTFVRPGETVLISGEALHETVAKVEIMPLGDVLHPASIGYVSEQNFQHLAQAGGTAPTWDAALAREVDVIQWTGDSLKFLVPDDFAPGVYAVKLTARNAGSKDVILYINNPDVDFVMGDEGEIATPGSSVRIVGHHLIPHGEESRITVALKAADGTVTTLQVTALKNENTYSLQAEIPADLAKGAYTLYVHSGYGDATAWSVGEPLTVADAPDSAWPTTVFNVRDFGAVGDGKINDTPAIVNALDAAAKNGGGVVFLPKGVYRVVSTLVIPENVVFKGEDKELSSIVWSPVRWPYSQLPEFLISIMENAEICDLGLHGTRFKGIFRVYGGVNEDGSMTRKASNIKIHDLRIQFYTRAGYITEGVQASTGELTMAEVNMLVSKELNQGYFLQPESGVMLYNFHMEDVAVDSDVAESDFHRGIHANYYYSVIRNVKFELGWSSMNGFGPIILEECEFENAALVLQGNFYLGNNYLHDLKGNNRELYTSDGTHRVDGAVVKLISNEPGNTVVEYADANKATPGGMVGWELYVIAGQGVGQVRRIIANTDKQITLDEPFAVAPNRNSLIAIHTPRTGSFFVNNTFENGAACGTYGTVINVVYDGNQFLRHGGQVFNVHSGVTWYVSTVNGLLDGPFYMHGDGDTATSPSGAGRYQFLFLYGIRPYSSLGYTFKNNRMLNGCYVLINWLSQSNGTRDFILEGNLFDEGSVGIQSSNPAAYGDGVLLRDNTFNTDMPYPSEFAAALNSNSHTNKVKDYRYINLDLLGEDVPVKGDVNLDGRVSLKDVTMIRYYLLESVVLTDAQIKKGDMDGDGVLTLMDANTIRRTLVTSA